MKDRPAGLLLFLPVPLVLVLLLRMPLTRFLHMPMGLFFSLGLGIVVMLTHALYARPFALARAHRRCLWCGCDLSPRGQTAFGGEDLRITLHEPRGITTWSACTPHHLKRLQSTLGYVARHRVRLGIGITGTLLIFLCASALIAAGTSQAVIMKDAAAFFQLGIALAVLPLGWLGPHYRGEIRQPLRLPFPAHIQALIGTLAVLWLFRLIGLLWLVQGLVHFIARIRML